MKKIKLGDLYFLSSAFTEGGNDCKYTKGMFYLKDVQWVLFYSFQLAY